MKQTTRQLKGKRNQKYFTSMSSKAFAIKKEHCDWNRTVRNMPWEENGNNADENCKNHFSNDHITVVVNF